MPLLLPALKPRMTWPPAGQISEIETFEGGGLTALLPDAPDEALEEGAGRFPGFLSGDGVPLLSLLPSPLPPAVLIGALP
jgi:hypothetical protein